MSDAINIADANDARKAGQPLKADGAPVHSKKWQAELATTEDGRVKATLRNFELILRLSDDWRGVLAFDERTGRVIFTSAPPFGRASDTVPREITETDTSRICQWLEAQMHIDVAPTNPKLNGAINLVAESRRTDAVREYLEGVEWDGEARLDTFLHRYFGAPDTKLNAAIGRKWMIGAVMRAMRPGAKFDYMLVLQGRQGVGKSRACAELAGHDFFGDGLPSVSGKDAADYLRGPWIIEMAELDAMGKAEATATKAFLTRTHDRYRAAYARRTQEHPRRCAFVGTTNEAAFLRDSTGNRRFWPVTVGDIDHAAIKADRDQLWAEALVALEAGEQCYLDTDLLVGEVQDAQEERFQADAWEPRIEAYLRRVVTSVAVGDVLEQGLGIKPERWGRPEQMRVGHVLQRLGWERKRGRVDGARVYLYYRPEGTQATEADEEREFTE